MTCCSSRCGSGRSTAKNRFYQVPHCNGMGYRDATALAAMRAVKAEGGWAVVCTEQAEIHPSSEICPFIELRIWDDQDLPMLARITDAIHAHGALAGLELCHNGMNSPNFYSREIPLGPANLPIATFTNDPVQARAMDKTDIANLRRWHRNAALRAKKADYDIVYVYAAKLLGGPMYFLSRRYNQRTDEYGGSLENRARLLRELIEDTKEAVGDRCGVACRISVDELIGEEGFHAAEAQDLIGLLGELPDLWDLTISGWDNDSATSRFTPEGYEEPYIRGIKQLTTKPVVGVGRFTSPDAMVRMVREGLLDLIGAARPSIADPVPAEEDRGGADRRDPRMHRLQHLRLRRLHHEPDPLHAEPDDGRGMAARLASRADRARAGARQGAGRRRRPGGARSRDDARAGAATTWRSPRRRRCSAAAWRGRRSFPASPPGSASPTIASISLSAWRTSRSTATAAWRRKTFSATAPSMSWSRPARAGAATAWRAAC